MTPRIYDLHPQYAGFPRSWEMSAATAVAVVVRVAGVRAEVVQVEVVWDVVMRTMP